MLTVKLIPFFNQFLGTPQFWHGGWPLVLLRTPGHLLTSLTLWMATRMKMAVSVRITEYMDRRSIGNVHIGCVYEIKEHADEYTGFYEYYNIHTHIIAYIYIINVCVSMSQ